MRSEKLLRAMAEELKLPLLQIARQAELATEHEVNPQLLHGIETSAAQALWFVDSYLLSQQLADQMTLELKPVAVSAALHDAAAALATVAQQHNCTLELALSGRYEPVMAHPEALHAALVGLGSSLIAAGEPGKPHRVVFAAHRGRNGVVAGVFSETEGVGQTLLRKGRAGGSMQIAHSLFGSMESQLRVAHHNKLNGLAATLPTSQQLSLV